jgi:catechol-2,3-dioxygenase
MVRSCRRRAQHRTGDRMAAAAENAICLSLSHLELYTRDARSMEEFYTHHLGFVVTDRGEGKDGMVFLSRNPREHHQLVLNPAAARPSQSPVDHISFRVDTLAELKVLHASLADSPAALQTVSHGNTWSVYFHDPDGNRLELFADTPWHVDQPCRFEIDLGLADAELIEFTVKTIRGLPGFRPAEEWLHRHARAVGGSDRAGGAE